VLTLVRQPALLLSSKRLVLDMDVNDNGWEKYKVHVVHELERSNERLGTIDKRLSKIESKLAVLDTKVYAATFIFSAVCTALFNFIAKGI